MISTRRHLATEQPTNFRPHDHVAWSGADASDLDYIAITCFAGATRRGERMMFVSDDPFDSGLGRLRNIDRLVERGALVLLPTAIAYEAALAGDTAGQFELFDAALDNALEDGYMGLCIVADASGPVSTDDQTFEQWLAWEMLADRFLAQHPVVGVCYFDTRRVRAARLADIASIHPVISVDFELPAFRIFSDGGRIRAIGDLDAWTSGRLIKGLRSVPPQDSIVLDLSGTGFVDHRALRALHALATSERPVTVVGAGPLVERVWKLLALQESGLRFA